MRRDGFTLMEAMIAMTVLALSVAAIAQAITAGHAQTADSLHRAKAVALAEAMMEEVLSKPYLEPDGSPVLVPGPEAGETGRALFDNMDDYHNFQAGVLDAAGVSYGNEYAGFTRAVTVSYSNTGFRDPRNADWVVGLLITVTVGDQAGASWQIQRFVEAPK